MQSNSTTVLQIIDLWGKQFPDDAWSPICSPFTQTLLLWWYFRFPAIGRVKTFVPVHNLQSTKKTLLSFCLIEPSWTKAVGMLTQRGNHFHPSILLLLVSNKQKSSLSKFLGLKMLLNLRENQILCFGVTWQNIIGHDE